MPFDSQVVAKTTTIAKREMVPDLSRPTLRGLEWVLRNDTKATKDWNFAHCATCAIGISTRLWGTGETPGALCIAFGITPQQARSIFANGAFSVGRLVTPQVVAGRIRDCMKDRPIRFLHIGDGG